MIALSASRPASAPCAALRRFVIALSLAIGGMALFAQNTSAIAQEPTETPASACPAAGVDPKRIAALARGFNLSGLFETASTPRIDRALLKRLRLLGFSHVRLPVGAALLEAPLAPEDTEARLSDIDSALDLLHGLGYAVTLDMHPGPAFQAQHGKDPEEAYARLEALWLRLAARYDAKNADWLFFELLNEPVLQDEDLWRRQAQRLITALRRMAPDRTLIVGTTGFQRAEVLTSRPPFDDPNIVYAVHFYDPMVFTHQGATWMAPEPFADLAGVPFPAATGDASVLELEADLERRGKLQASAAVREALLQPWTRERIDSVFTSVEAWSRRHGRPVMVNEFGVLAGAARPADRIAWIEGVRRSAERHCMGWTYWELDRGFGFVDPARANGIDLDIVFALLQP